MAEILRDARKLDEGVVREQRLMKTNSKVTNNHKHNVLFNVLLHRRSLTIHWCPTRAYDTTYTRAHHVTDPDAHT